MNENEKKLALINVLGIEIIAIVLLYYGIKGNEDSSSIIIMYSLPMWLYIGFTVFVEYKIGWFKYIMGISRAIGSVMSLLFCFISGLGDILAVAGGLLVMFGGIVCASLFFVVAFPIYALYCAGKKDFSAIMFFKGSKDSENNTESVINEPLNEKKENENTDSKVDNNIN